MDSFLTPYGLSNSGQEKLQFTPFWVGPKPGCSDGLLAGSIESHNFFVLGPILVKFHIRTRLIESIPTIFRTWWCGEEKLHFTPFWGGPKLVCSDGLRAETTESHNFFVLGPILVKFHIRTRLIEGFPTIFWTCWCAEEKLHFTPFHTLRQLKRDEALFPPLGRVVDFRAWYS